MLKKNFFLILFLVLAISIIPVFVNGEEENQSKKYDLMFSLAGGNIGGKFTLTGNFLYAREFGETFFAQAAGFVDISGDKKEYGTSVGIGANTEDEAFSLYLFGDSLYSYQNWWFQVRPVIRLRTEYLGLEAFYAFPIRVASIFNLQSVNFQDTVYINGKEVWVVSYWGGEAEIVPVDWARIYGSAMLVQNTYKRFKIGAEIRFWKYLSLSTSWHKQDSGIYSKWGSYDDFSIALNILFGAKQSSFSPVHKLAVTPRYPILAEKKKEPEPEPNFATFEVKYRRVLPVVRPNMPDPTGDWAMITFPGGGGTQTSRFVQVGANEWQAEVILEYSKLQGMSGMGRVRCERDFYAN